VKRQFFVVGCVLLCLGMVFSASNAVGQLTYPTQSGNWSEVSWTNGQPDGIRTDLRSNYTTTVNQPYTVGAVDHQHGMLGPGYGGVGTVYVESTLTNRGGNQIGVDNEGWMYIRNGGALNVNGVVGGQWSIRIGSDINGAGTGKGHLIVEPGGVVNATGGWTHVNLYGAPGNSLEVNGGGGAINLNQLRLESGALVAARPTANGAAGLTTINCTHLVIGGTGANANTGTTLRIAPSYPVSVGDSWAVVTVSSQSFNQFEHIETVPPDLGVNVSYADNMVTVTVTDVPGPPAAPTNLVLTPYRHNIIDISWTDNSGTDYRLERSLDGENYDASVNLTGPVNSYQNTGLTQGTTYYYRVIAVSPYGESDPLEGAAASGMYKIQVGSGDLSEDSIWEDGEAPRPQDRVYAMNYHHLDVSGTHEVSQVYGPGWNSISSMTLSGSLTTTRTTDYGMRIGNGADSVGFLTIDGGNYTGGGNLVVGQEEGHGVIYIKANSNVELTVGPQRFMMIGAFNSTVDSGKFIVEGPGSTFSFGQFRFNNINPSENAFVIRPTANGSGGLSEVNFGGSHYVNPYGAHLEVAPLYVPQVGDSWTILSGFGQYIDIMDGQGGATFREFDHVRTVPSDLGVSVQYNEGPNNVVVTVTAVPTEPAKQPTDVSVTGVAHNVMEVSWANNGDAYGFLIERASGPEKNGWIEVGTLPSNFTTFHDTNAILPETTYEYQITALGAVANSAPSDSASGDSLPEPPEAPSDLTAEEDGGYQIDLAWTDNSDREDGFSIERREDVEGEDFEEVATVDADVTEYSDETVAPARTYVYRVRAFNEGGYSEFSEEATATTDTALIVELDSKTSSVHLVTFETRAEMGVEVFFAQEDPTFQWYRQDPLGGDPIPVGTDDSVFVIESVAYEDAGIYWCEVTAGPETENSPMIELVVQQPMPLGGLFGLSMLSVLLALAAVFTLRRQSCQG